MRKVNYKSDFDFLMKLKEASGKEIAVTDIPPYTKAQYDAEVERLIAEKYSHGKEIEVNREHDTKPERFAEYLAYIEECKVRARENLAEMERREREQMQIMEE